MFCKNCGTLLQPKCTSYGRWMACPHGHSQPELNQDKNVVTIKNDPVKRVEVSDGENILAVYAHQCKKCGYDKAELIDIMPFYSDEDCVSRMKCGKCGCVEQLEGKTK